MRSLLASILTLFLTSRRSLAASTLDTIQSQVNMPGEFRSMNIDHWHDFCPPGQSFGFPQGITTAQDFLAYKQNSCYQCLLGDILLFDASKFPLVLDTHPQEPPPNLKGYTFPRTISSNIELAEFLATNCWHVEARPWYDTNPTYYDLGLMYTQRWSCVGC